MIRFLDNWTLERLNILACSINKYEGRNTHKIGDLENLLNQSAIKE